MKVIVLTLSSIFLFLGSVFGIERADKFSESPLLPFPESPLTVVLREAPPFVIKTQGPEGEIWRGIAVELWEQCATDLGLDFIYREQPSLNRLLQEVADQEADVAVGALTVTAERERVLDFSNPFYAAGLSLATEGHSTSLIMSVFDVLFRPDLWMWILALLALLTGVGFFAWVFERRANPEEFGGGLVKGLGAGLWWSAVTMTTVGYGDKSPKSFGGRIVGLIWMFAAILLISTFTAAIASAITVKGLQASIQGFDDLRRPGVITAVVQGSTTEEFLNRQRVVTKPFLTLQEAIKAVDQGRADAVVHDRPLLKFRLQESGMRNIYLLPEEIETQFYGFALPELSPLREPLNRILQDNLASENWRTIQARYLGP